MTRMHKKTLWAVGIFAISMAYLESAVVVYLRRIYGINDLTSGLTNFDSQIAAIEIGRECATLFMLWAIGWVASRRFQSRFGFTIFAFGLWDIFYYIWLRIFLGWPASAMDMDLLFLIPLPWWGPVLAPLLISTLLVAAGARIVFLDDLGIRIHFNVFQKTALVFGLLIILYSFMADALALLPVNSRMLSQMIPSAFNWPVFITGFFLLAYTIWQAIF